MTKLSTIIKDKKLEVTDKGSTHCYIDEIYEPAFSSILRSKMLNILEIGVHTGESLVLWEHAFPSSNIYGVDTLNNVQCKYSNRVKFIRGDGYEQSTLNQLPNLDIVIDDGSHKLSDQLKCLEVYIPKLNQGGMLFIEDIENVAYLQTLVDAVKDRDDVVYEAYDYRDKKGRYDDIVLAVIKK